MNDRRCFECGMTVGRNPFEGQCRTCRETLYSCILCQDKAERENRTELQCHFGSAHLRVRPTTWRQPMPA